MLMPVQRTAVTGSYPLAASVLRWMLWITAAVGALSLAGAAQIALTPEPPEANHDLPDMAPVAIAGLSFVGSICLAFALLGIGAFRRRRRGRSWMAPLFVALAALLPLAGLILSWSDAREEMGAMGIGPLVFGIVVWGWTIFVLASSPTVLREIGLENEG